MRIQANVRHWVATVTHWFINSVTAYLLYGLMMATPI